MPATALALRMLPLSACALLIAGIQGVPTAVADDAWKVEIRKDVSYLAEGRDEKLDLYLPRRKGNESSNTQHPAVASSTAHHTASICNPNSLIYAH